MTAIHATDEAVRLVVHEHRTARQALAALVRRYPTLSSDAIDLVTHLEVSSRAELEELARITNR